MNNKKQGFLYCFISLRHVNDLHMIFVGFAFKRDHSGFVGFLRRAGHVRTEVHCHFLNRIAVLVHHMDDVGLLPVRRQFGCFLRIFPAGIRVAGSVQILYKSVNVLLVRILRIIRLLLRTLYTKRKKRQESDPDQEKPAEFFSAKSRIIWYDTGKKQSI